MNADTVLAYLAGQQLEDGSFAAMAGTNPEAFMPQRQQPSIFPTILILDCLHSVVGSEAIRQRASKYVEAQVSPQGSWNYWDTQTNAVVHEPYPDDLDDTACALAALKHTDPAWVTSFRLGQFARLLVAAEEKAGGPYNTWLIDTKKAAQWRQTDVAVNANIAYALSLEATRLHNLDTYLIGALRQQTLASAYYVGELPVIYFLSRAASRSINRVLRKRVLKLLDERVGYNALQNALLLSAACRLEIPKSRLQAIARVLQNQKRHGYWPAEAFYIDPAYSGHQHYGGSAALTTAFALEALVAFATNEDQTPVMISNRRGTPLIMQAIQEDARRIVDSDLRRHYLKTARLVVNDRAGDQIVEPARHIVRAGKYKLSDAQIEALDRASVNGWIAYTLYDNVLDGDGSRAQLAVANAALRRSQAYFMGVLPNNQAYQRLVQHTFDTMDAVNYWEVESARATIENGKIIINKLPAYAEDYRQLAERSVGHGLAACSVLVVHYGRVNAKPIKQLQSFYHHFLIARQLHDDAHDWEDDLAAGRLSSVVVLMLKNSYTLPCCFTVKSELETLRQDFWLHTITEVTAAIQEHIAAAREVLVQLSQEMDCSVFSGWLDKLEAAADVALQGRQDAMQFMRAYEGHHVT